MNAREPTLIPPRVERDLQELLTELSACGHQPSMLINRTRLPRWCRRSLFFFLGYVARADGRVTEKDIQFAESLMKAFSLSPYQRRRAIHHFHRGKSSDVISNGRALRLRLTHRLWPWPALQVAICLGHAAQLHGAPSRARRYRCEDAVHHMGLPVELLQDIFDSYGQKVWITQPERYAPPSTFDDACQLLGVSRNASLTDIKRAYRRKVSGCHPDKLGVGHTEREYRIANDRLYRYQQAWELIRKKMR
ncbi:DnaJ like chaperone protein [Tamilnaduibacter salinus]|uniref:DnaJ like chaperone protein n=1 Tax=Tamilnaduibacter salinus TaxID=1484056 RepID=A0A2U1CWS8_9GAMM|nr:DnaJ domain-containing protein [Tamilnaduibacter salinus]PVY76449.1 DnaJ like chaperone protein [Tamilnaduibacter salinus]